eukprot:CAMPEP_0115881276 /NCGR_PEP_ID=MMETSP0287-20121206/28345_1 /TAXON_ID=412157 /ORGANISM="Chrysochromulina rotalis, Strain UIO044" /LENGTH=104 /DNA_ID=CAMNT_0003337197 /DNA_START=6 /DNA_END=320 /DNA_ORIENTATION=-
MPTAMLLVQGGAEMDLNAAEAAIIDGARAFVRAAVSVVTGACESEGGATCILGDKRRNVLLATSDWSDVLEEDGDDVARRRKPVFDSGETPDSLGLELDDYPDL